MNTKMSPEMAKNSQYHTAKAVSVSPNRDWNQVPKRKTKATGSSTSKTSSRRHRSNSSFRKNGGGSKKGKKLFTRVTKKVVTTANVVKILFRAEKRAFAVKAAKNQPAVVQENKCLTLDALQEFRAEEKKMDSQKKAVKATPSPTSKSVVVKKNRLSNKVVVNVPSVVTCRLKLVENKEETYFFLIISGHFLTKKQGQEASDAAFAILQKEIATATKKADGANKREATHAEARQIARDRRAPRRKSLLRKESTSSTSVTTFNLDGQDFPTMSGEYLTAADSDDAEFPEPDELFVNILEGVSESPVQLEKEVCSKKVSQEEEVIVNSDDLATLESLRIAHLEEQLKIMQAFIHQMTVPRMIQ